MTSYTERAAEITQKLGRLRTRMDDQKLTLVHINQIANTSWITAGARLFINEGTDSSASSIVVTPDRAILLSNTIEVPRLIADEGIEALGFEVVAEPWHSSGAWLTSAITGKQVGHDGSSTGTDVTALLQDLRSHLQPQEVTRMREVALLAGAAMDEAIRGIQPGMTEYAAAGLLAAAARKREGTAIVNLVASDERIAQFRHPLPMAKAIERYAMLVLCMRQQGMIGAVTRLVHFGALPDDLRRRALAVANVDARMILGTQAGRTMGEMFDLAKTAYTDLGYPEAIDEHHQGGSIAYGTREVVAMPSNTTPITIDQCFAWNPSVRGVKSEDTTLLTEQGHEVLTAIPNWPTWDVTIDGVTLARPAILEL